MNSFVNKLGIGTAQWGMDYGVSNVSGQTTKYQAGAILETAKKAEIKLIDTACLYGVSEDVLGKYDLSFFDVVTKTPHFKSPRITEDDVDLLLNTFYASLAKLGLKSIYGLLIHDASNISVPGGEMLVCALQMLQQQGKVLKIGFSAYTKAQIETACTYFCPDIVQVPLNILDQRLVVDGTIESLAGRGVEIHARSVFLQGLLLMSPNAIPNYFNPWIHQLKKWHQICSELNVSPRILALHWVCSIPEISYALVGMQNQSHLEELISDCSQVVIPSDLRALSSVDEYLLNPSLWRL